MTTIEQILRYLNNDSWFTPSRSRRKAIIKDVTGKDMEVPESYYHHFDGQNQISIRVSNHGTALKTWIRRSCFPNDSLQNLSIVFGIAPTYYNTEIPKTDTILGNITFEGERLYFVVEQYVYNLNKISLKDFKKVINTIKRLEENGVFLDPLKKKPDKRASRTVLIPTDDKGNKVPSSGNTVSDRQKAVARYPDKEIDSNCNIIEKKIREIVRECINRELRRILQ